MDGVLIYFITLVVVVKPYHLNYDDSDYENYDDRSYAKTLPDNKTQQETTTTKATSNYEVTENVIDIQDNRTLGPIITNYTISKPLNTIFVPAENKTEENKYVTKIYNNRRKNYINLLHINAEYDKLDEITPSENINTNDCKVNEYLNGIKEFLVKGFNRVINKHRLTGIHNIAAVPLMILKNLHRKGTDVADQFHKAIFGDPF